MSGQEDQSEEVRQTTGEEEAAGEGNEKVIVAVSVFKFTIDCELFK